VQVWPGAGCHALNLELRLWRAVGVTASCRWCSWLAVQFGPVLASVSLLAVLNGTDR